MIEVCFEDKDFNLKWLIHFFAKVTLNNWFLILKTIYDIEVCSNDKDLKPEVINQFYYRLFWNT